VSLGGIAALGIGLSADAQFPEIGTDLQITRQADGAIGEGQADGKGHTEGMSRVREGTGSASRLGIRLKLDIGLGLMDTFLSADIFGGMVGEVVAVAGKAIAEGTQGDAVLVVAALQAGQGQIIAVGMTEANGAQGMPVGVDGPQDIVKAFCGIAQILADGEAGEAQVQVFESRQGQQVVVAVGGSQAAGDGPEGKETVVEDVEGFGLVAEVMLASGNGAQFGIPVSIWVRSRLVGAGVEVIPNSG
jgi:hypothetical protein